MYCKVHHPVNTPGSCDNKGSCGQLVKYLSKESDMGLPYFDTFFSQGKDFVTAGDVTRSIDSNHRTLKRKSDKFYMLTVNPSQDEARSLIFKVTGRKVKSLDELSVPEKQEVIQEMKNYARTCMDEYSRNFYREKIHDGNDLVWYGRVETQRCYKHTDQKVKDGLVKVGEPKEGLQLHVHIIVSRMDRSQTISLSPLSRSRGSRQSVNGHQSIVGFDRSEWANRCAMRFGYDYDHTPFYIKNQNEYKDWREKHRMRSLAVSNAKKLFLQGELRYERKLLSTFVRSYRFIVNPRFVFLQELKNKGSNILGGRGL